MKIEAISAGNRQISEIVSAGVLIRSTQDALDLIANANAPYLVLHEHNFAPDFFDLSTRKLGEVLQKFATYRRRAAIVGNFERYPGKALRDFIYESNQRGDYLFLPTIDDVIDRWQG